MKFSNLKKKAWPIPLVVSLLSLGGAFGVYVIAKKQQQDQVVNKASNTGLELSRAHANERVLTPPQTASPASPRVGAAKAKRFEPADLSGLGLDTGRIKPPLQDVPESSSLIIIKVSRRVEPFSTLSFNSASGKLVNNFALDPIHSGEGMYFPTRALDGAQLELSYYTTSNNSAGKARLQHQKLVLNCSQPPRALTLVVDQTDFRSGPEVYFEDSKTCNLKHR